MSKFEEIIQTMSGAILESIVDGVRDEALDGDDVEDVVEFVKLKLDRDNGNIDDFEYEKKRQAWLDRHLWKFATEAEVRQDVTEAHRNLSFFK